MDDFQEFLPWGTKRMEQSRSEKEKNAWVVGGRGAWNQDEFDVFMGHSSGDAEQATGWIGLEFRGEVEAKGLD